MVIAIVILVSAVVIVAYVLGHHNGKKAGHDVGVAEGRGRGWKACETLIINRMLNSKHINLNEREILDEFIQ